MPGGNATPAPRKAEGSSGRKLPEHDSYLQFYSRFGQTGKMSMLLGTGSSREKSCSASPRTPGDIPLLQHGTVGHWGASPP